MRRFSILFIVLGLISLLSASSYAQRGVGGHILTLDDGVGHLVNITVPVMAGPGPYSWTVPITTGGTALTLPSGTTTNSTLFWNGSQWVENPTLLAGTGIYAGTLTVPSSIGIPTALSLVGANSGGAQGGAVSINAGQAGSAISSGGSVLITGGGGYGSGVGSGSAGGSVQITGGPGNTGNATGGSVTLLGGQASLAGTGAAAIVQGGSGGNTGTGGPVQIYGGAGGNSSGPGGNISFLTTPNNNGNFAQAMQITNTGSVQIGSSNQFTVDKNGHMVTTSSIGTVSFTGGVSGASAVGSDVAGVITFSSTSLLAVSTITVNYGTTYGTAPVVIVTPANQQAGSEWGTSVTQGGGLMPYVTCNASSFVITFYDWYGAFNGNLNYVVVH